MVQALHVFKYLEIYYANDLAFNPWYQRITSDQNVQSKVKVMKDLYVDAGEEIPTNAPKPRGKPFQVNRFVDFDHAGDRDTQIFQKVIILYCNSVPITWYYKRQNTVESSTFGAESLALKIATDLIASLIYKLRMIGVTIGGATNVFCDNE